MRREKLFDFVNLCEGDTIAVVEFFLDLNQNRPFRSYQK